MSVAMKLGAELIYCPCWE